MKDQAEIFDRLKMEVDEALDELSNYDAAFAEEEGGAQEKQETQSKKCRRCVWAKEVNQTQCCALSHDAPKGA